jgi:hypothetical protein
MLRRLSVSTIVGLLFFTALDSYAQDPLAEQRIRGLKGLRSVALVVQRKDELQIVNDKEVSDIIQVALSRDVRNLVVKDKAEEASDWLLLLYVVAKGGGYVRLSAQRRVTLYGTNTDLVAETWHAERVMVGTVTALSFNETVRTLLTGFAADYIRANQ